MRFRLEITPDLGEAAEQYGRAGQQFDDRIMDDAFTEFEQIPAREAKQRANARGSGWTRLASTIRPVRASSGTVGAEFGGLPDAAGWEFGSNQYRQFGSYLGGKDGYATHSLIKGDWFSDFGEDIADEVWDELTRVMTK